MKADSLPAFTFPKGLKDDTLPAATDLIKIHQKSYGPIWFSPAHGKPPAYRFDAPAGQYGIIYTAREIDGAFVETVLRKPTGRILGRGFVEDRAWTILRAKRPLVLAKLYDEGLLWHGTDANIGSVDKYDEPGAMAVALHATFPKLDGIAWRARHDNGQLCYALFDRVKADLEIVSTKRFEDHWAEVERLMDKYGATFSTSAPIPPP